jgi:hypothetical protein
MWMTAWVIIVVSAGREKNFCRQPRNHSVTRPPLVAVPTGVAFNHRSFSRAVAPSS